MDAMSTNPEKFSLDKKSWRGLQFQPSLKSVYNSAFREVLLSNNGKDYDDNDFGPLIK